MINRAFWGIPQNGQMLESPKLLDCDAFESHVRISFMIAV